MKMSPDSSMEQMMSGSPAGADAKPSSSPNLDSIPLDTLQMPDESEQMQPPEVGDEVNYTVTGKVVSIEGGTAKVQKTAINGQAVDADGDTDNSPENEGAEDQALRDEAGAMDSKQFGM